jgi:hypothetical protein
LSTCKGWLASRKIKQNGQGKVHTVADWTGHQGAYKSAIDIFFRSVKNRLQEVVGLFYLVPEEEVRLTEFEALDVVLLLDRDSEHIRGSEDPTSSTAALVRHRRAFEGNRQVEVLAVMQNGRGLLEYL